eukprot:gnl/Dysnectes_brevis/2678_a3241_1886.p1 GENE.gnl/Dysnectes_brevis/2678_a3241_1886~~gnl/Dysnectes_brevis/2678_a3241_1886.p1  ORF type:complete len:207 (+),score=32.59 gnl/Dysnectes_brevis/2678_a3241_1886:31-621(+)
MTDIRARLLEFEGTYQPELVPRHPSKVQQRIVQASSIAGRGLAYGAFGAAFGGGLSLAEGLVSSGPAHTFAQHKEAAYKSARSFALWTWVNEGSHLAVNTVTDSEGALNDLVASFLAGVTLSALDKQPVRKCVRRGMMMAATSTVSSLLFSPKPLNTRLSEETNQQYSELCRKSRVPLDRLIEKISGKKKVVPKGE